MLYSFVIFLALIGTFMQGCTQITAEPKYPTGEDRAIAGGDIYTKGPSIFGDDGFSLFSGKGNDKEHASIGVNAYLWRASLDTISFMPLDSADPFGGVITTEWYTTSAAPTERIKVNVLILSKTLKSDAIRVRAFKQENIKGAWQDMDVSSATERELENAILTRARQLKVAEMSQ